ncbi:probable LRR receptor-like serine/threonine-protein kinase At3g47570 [Punica granatum]|uniref:non-specific serine/threonine protein kinase n=1 Tax=Punica granatum TaxID=22663 RepID=A0A6P8EB25_PUNGR|nr:probable LRR receptor-like serine/threonine-protein kinase At3g47570 [Punica granatum]
MELPLPCRSRFFFPISSLIIITLLSCSVLGVNGIPGNETDRLALLEFKAFLSDPLGVLDSWNITIHFCQWYGVTCGRRHRRVIALDLRSLNLGGIISPSIGNLTFLRVLNIQNNSFHSRIPPEVGHLYRLRGLHLNNNSLDGPIPPSLSRCFNLVILRIHFNMLAGNLPTELSSLSKLKGLILYANGFTGPIPGSYGNLSSLVNLGTTRNELGGMIPDTLGNLQNLKVLSLGANNFVGTIPTSIFNISSLESLDVTKNQLVGSLPSDLGFTLPVLQFLSFGLNHFTGPIPKTLSNLSDLTLFNINRNNFTGEAPSFQKMNELRRVTIGSNHLGGRQVGDLDFLCTLTNSTKLETLTFHSNNFKGNIPECISNLSTTLKSFSSVKNMLSGGLPGTIGNLINLEQFFMDGNNISGNIPSEIGNLARLKQLYLGWNEFSEEIPHTMGNLSMLTHLSLRSNSLQGAIPSSLSKCRSLLLLDLADNKLSGAIPPEIMEISSLSIYADFSSNNLTDKLPMEVGNLKNLGILILQDNRISGEIPSSLGSCIMMENLYMQDNLFEGSIPSTLGNLKGIRNLNLSNNMLSGRIPKFLEDLNLTSLGLALNEFEGAVPTGGIFKNASATSLIGNKHLCGGLAEFRLPKCNTEEPRRVGTMNSARIIIISSVSGLLGLLLILVLLYILWCKRQRKAAASEFSRDGLWKVSYQSLLKATNGFSSINLIGSGSFGLVFRGVFDWNQTIVAVKVLNLKRYRAAKSFISECEALRNIRHRNLVKVITACSGTDYQGNDFKALIYEFMVNGSLDGWLHPIVKTIKTKEEAPRQLTLLQRLNISIDVASALDYLHNQCDVPIVHCDLKPSNVLLDDEMTAHVGDFGLVRFLPEATRESIADPSSSIGVKGSLGYIAPGKIKTLHSSCLLCPFFYYLFKGQMKARLTK